MIPGSQSTVLFLAACMLLCAPGIAQIERVPVAVDSDKDGLPNSSDSCPQVSYQPGFSGSTCAPMDLNPNNDSDPECKARERVANLLLNNGMFTTRIAFAVVENGKLHFADAFEYIGGGQFRNDPDGIHRLYRIGSTSKAVTAVTAKILEENGVLHLDDFVSDEDGSQITSNGQRTLRQLLRHQGAFKLDAGALHLFCYPGDMPSFWAEDNDSISPHYDSPTYGNLGGGYQYSAFNYSLAGTYLQNQAGLPFSELVQRYLFDYAGMCTASFDGSRAVTTSIGNVPGVSQSAVMHVGPTINLVSQSDPLCEDNYYSSNALPGDPYTWLYYRMDEASAQPRDPAGGVIASVVDMGHFAEALLDSYHQPNGLLSQAGIRDLWGSASDLGCGSNCPYEPYYGTGFFTNTQPGNPIQQVGHGGSRAGYSSAFVVRPEDNRAVIILANADVSTTSMSDLAKTILDDFQ